MRHKNKFFYLFRPVLAFFIGIIGWSYAEGGFAPIVALFPFLWANAKTRKEAFFVAFAYYLAASRGIVHGAYIFFQDGSIARAIILWIGSSLLLSLPWTFKINDKDSFGTILLKFSCVTLASVPPPLGIIGWVNPLLAAGVFFPEWGFWGFVGIIFVWAIGAKIIWFRRLCVAVVILMVLYPGNLLEVPRHEDFVGVNISMGQIASGSASLENIIFGYDHIRAIFDDLEARKNRGELDAKNIVLPETICGRLNKISEEEWKNGVLRILGSENDRTLFLGGELDTPDGKKYDNVIISFGADEIYYRQKIPVPFSMFRPWSDDGANGYLFEAEIVQLTDGIRAGLIVCYEQLIPWAWVLMLIGNDWQSPDVVICPTNNWWCKDTSLPPSQALTRVLLSRLFWMPVVSAENK